MSASANSLVDSFGRRITYVRLSVTDRCDLRCRYCMAEKMTFLPKDRLLTFEEIEALVDTFIARGVRRVRLTGGEPLVRRGILDLVGSLGCRIGKGLDELTLTTNGTQLAAAAGPLFESGVRRVNVSLDSLDSGRFAHITRRGRLDQVLNGIAAARSAGLSVKINMVALKGLNDDEIEPMLRWCAAEDHDLTLIETMPLGSVEDDRADRYLPLDRVKRELERRYTLLPSIARTGGGPASYFDVRELGLRLGLITPLTNNFCSGCNRIRVTATGTVYGCLGHDQKVELRELLRSGGSDRVNAALDELLAGKPRRHDFDISAAAPAVQRHMSVTGG
jgi:cyclic pyranopterin phosphate synthase